MRYRITFRYPSKPWEMVFYKDSKETMRNEEMTLTFRKADDIQRIAREVQSELKKGNFELVRIEEAPEN